MLRACIHIAAYPTLYLQKHAHATTMHDKALLTSAPPSLQIDTSADSYVSFARLRASTRFAIHYTSLMYVFHIVHTHATHHFALHHAHTHRAARTRRTLALTLGHMPHTIFITRRYTCRRITYHLSLQLYTCVITIHHKLLPRSAAPSLYRFFPFRFRLLHITPLS